MERPGPVRVVPSPLETEGSDGSLAISDLTEDEEEVFAKYEEGLNCLKQPLKGRVEAYRPEDLLNRFREKALEEDEKGKKKGSLAQIRAAARRGDIEKPRKQNRKAEPVLPQANRNRMRLPSIASGEK